MIIGPIARVAPPPQMPQRDQDLLDLAQDLLHRVWTRDRHEVATALRTAAGGVYTGVHLEGSCRRSSVCAEPVALGAARAGLAPDAPLHLDSVVSVQVKPDGQFRVIAPCGVCRELISDYSPQARVWVTSGERVTWRAAIDLLPDKTMRRW